MARGLRPSMWLLRLFLVGNHSSGLVQPWPPDSLHDLLSLLCTCAHICDFDSAGTFVKVSQFLWRCWDSDINHFVVQRQPYFNHSQLLVHPCALWVCCAIRVITVLTERFWSRLSRAPLDLVCAGTRALRAPCRIVRSGACCALDFMVAPLCHCIFRSARNDTATKAKAVITGTLRTASSSTAASATKHMNAT